MTVLTPSLKLLRVMAGEGNFHIYRLLKERRRVFLFAKCILTTFAYFKGTGCSGGTGTVAFIKGPNQLRYYHHARTQLQEELGPIKTFTYKPSPEQLEARLLSRISLKEACHQAYYLLIMLLTGKRRYLNLYLLSFATAIEKAVAIGLNEISTFVCFNDQPYDVSAIVYALNRRTGVRTIVIQHGLILSESFYFPSVAKEFWAWGELSRTHYRSSELDGKLIIKGRYKDDFNNKQHQPVWPQPGRPVRILVAPSFFHHEVKTLINHLNQSLGAKLKENTQIAIKFHPATKFLWFLKKWCIKAMPQLTEEYDPMETLSSQYDVLVTKNSTSSIDFLLRGKPVFSVNINPQTRFPSEAYTFQLRDINLFLSNKESQNTAKNNERLRFLYDAINI